MEIPGRCWLACGLNAVVPTSLCFALMAFIGQQAAQHDHARTRQLNCADGFRKEKVAYLSYKVWGKRLNKFLKYIEDTLHPDLFILGGGVSKKMDRFEDAINIKTPLVPAIKLNNAGIIGAAEHVKEQLDLVHNSN